MSGPLGAVRVCVLPVTAVLARGPWFRVSPGRSRSSEAAGAGRGLPESPSAGCSKPRRAAPRRAGSARWHWQCPGAVSLTGILSFPHCHSGYQPAPSGRVGPAGPAQPSLSLGCSRPRESISVPVPLTASRPLPKGHWQGRRWPQFFFWGGAVLMMELPKRYSTPSEGGRFAPIKSSDYGGRPLTGPRPDDLSELRLVECFGWVNE